MKDLQLKHHVEHPIRAVGLQKLHYVSMFQHVADARFPLQIYRKTKNRLISVSNQAKFTNTELLLQYILFHPGSHSELLRSKYERIIFSLI